MGGRSGNRRRSPAVDQLLRLVDEAYDHRTWHGTTLRGSLRGMTPGQAAWRPAPTRHNVWELVLHCAYWKYAVRRRLSDVRRGSFSLSGSNWFATPASATRGAWGEALQLLRSEHGQLRTVIDDLGDEVLDQPAGRGTTKGALIRGIASHDLYHAGQIQLLKKLYEVQ